MDSAPVVSKALRGPAPWFHQVRAIMKGTDTELSPEAQVPIQHPRGSPWAGGDSHPAAAPQNVSSLLSTKSFLSQGGKRFPAGKNSPLTVVVASLPSSANLLGARWICWMEKTLNGR